MAAANYSTKHRLTPEQESPALSVSPKGKKFCMTTVCVCVCLALCPCYFYSHIQNSLSFIPLFLTCVFSHIFGSQMALQKHICHWLLNQHVSVCGSSVIIVFWKVFQMFPESWVCGRLYLINPSSLQKRVTVSLFL